MRINLIGDKAMNLVISHQPGVKLAVEAQTNAIGAKAERLLAIHRQTGEARIEVDFGDVDGYVTLADENGLSIEYGHWNKLTGTYTPGLYIITRAAGFI